MGTRRAGRVLTVAAGFAGFAVLFLWPGAGPVEWVVDALYDVLLAHGVPSHVLPDDYGAALNVLAFVPLGWVGVSWLRWHPARVVLALVALSVGIEAVQELPWLDRTSSAQDVACNALGAVVGVVLGSLSVARSRRAARRRDVEVRPEARPG
jgi:VanZ family protein